jgi:hypothetical protein
MPGGGPLGISHQARGDSLAPGEAERSDVEEPALCRGSLASRNETEIVDAFCSGENRCGEDTIGRTAAGRFNLDFADQRSGWVVQANFEGTIAEGSVL